MAAQAACLRSLLIFEFKCVYQHQQTHAAPSEVVAQALGYTTINGPSKGVIATLKQCGLLEGAGDGPRVSDH